MIECILGDEMDYIDKLKEIRKNRGYTEQEIAKICGVSVATVLRWENRKSKIKTKHIVTLCALYKVSANYILDLPKDLDYPNK